MNLIDNKTLYTERLILRKFKIEDAQQVYDNWTSDSQTAKFLSWNVHKDVEETKSVIQKWIDDYNNNVYNWVVELKENGQVIGNIATVSIHKRDDVAVLGYCYGSKFWNKGYGTEALRRVIEFLLYDCDFEVVEAHHISGNPASGRIMQKAGMHLDAILPNRRYNKFTKERNDLVIYSIDKKQFEARNK